MYRYKILIEIQIVAIYYNKGTLTNIFSLSEDSVYIEGENQRVEYILSDTGLIWRGTTNRPRPSVWKYAQFEKDILECSLYLITKIGRVGIGNLGDPVKTARALSAAVSLF